MKKAYKCWQNSRRKLKSDHCGIEINFYTPNKINFLSLKSDHCGIEMLCQQGKTHLKQLD